MESTKTLEYYKRLPYTLHTEPGADGKYWLAEYAELRGCKTDGETEAAAVANLQELFDDFISTLIEEKAEIPEPQRRLVPVPPVWTVVPPAAISSQKENTTETEISWEATRFQVGHKENLVAYID